MSETEMLAKLLKVASQLDMAYLKAIENTEEGSFTGEEYDELNDVMADVEEYLKKKGYEI